MNENSQDSGIIELRHSFWDWLTVQKKVSNKAPVSPNKFTKSKSKTQEVELDKFYQEAGL